MIGEKCDRCEPGYWRMTSSGCQRKYVIAYESVAQTVTRKYRYSPRPRDKMSAYPVFFNETKFSCLFSYGKSEFLTTLLSRRVYICSGRAGAQE